MWLHFWKAVSKISIWLPKKIAFTIHYSLICLVRQKCGWKGNYFDRRVKNLKCGWQPPDAGELALLFTFYLYFLCKYNKFQQNIFYFNFSILFDKVSVKDWQHYLNNIFLHYLAGLLTKRFASFVPQFQEARG